MRSSPTQGDDRALRALGHALASAIACAATLAHAETSWPRLPTDAEIDGARALLVAERTFTSEQDCTAKCGAGDDVATMVCRARECMDRCRLGPEIVASELTQIETIKAHQPQHPDPLASAYVFALTTTMQTRDDCNGRTWNETGYGIEALAWREGGWYWSVQRFGQEVRQQDPANKAQRDAEFASYFGPGRFVAGFPQAAMPSPEPYRVTVRADDAMHPLRLAIFVERLRPAAGPLAQPAQAVYEPAAGVGVALGATSYAGNESRLSLHLVSSDCRNCTDELVDGRSVQRISDHRQPILLAADADGYARVELFLDFAALAVSGQLAPASGLTLPLQVGVLAPAAPGERERLQAEVRHELRLPGIGVVDAIHFEASRVPGQARLQARQMPLSEYRDDPGTRDGERTLAGADRVKVKRHGEALILEPGSAPGSTLRAGHLLQVGDLISVNACGTDTRPIVDGLPAGQPAQIWVSVRFFDGLRGRFGVNAQVCRAALSIGRSRTESGFLSLQQRFIYWAADQGVDAAVETLFAPARVVNVAREVLGWMRQGLGYDATYVILNSALAVESSPDGTLQISTRAGEPLVLTAGTGADGVAVPAGMTAAVTGDDTRVDVTSGERGERADAWLAQLRNGSSAADSMAPADAGAAYDTAAAPAPYPADAPVDGNHAAGWIALGLALVAAIAGVLGFGYRRAARAGAAATQRRRRRHAGLACPACGQPASAGARFCGHCGRPLG